MLAMADRIPIPPHLGGGWVDDPGPVPLDRRAKWARRRDYAFWRHRKMSGPEPQSTPQRGFCEEWHPDEIEECARFAKMKRDE